MQMCFVISIPVQIIIFFTIFEGLDGHLRSELQRRRRTLPDPEVRPDGRAVPEVRLQYFCIMKVGSEVLWSTC